MDVRAETADLSASLVSCSTGLRLPSAARAMALPWIGTTLWYRLPWREHKGVYGGRELDMTRKREGKFPTITFFLSFSSLKTYNVGPASMR